MSEKLFANLYQIFQKINQKDFLSQFHNILLRTFVKKVFQFS